MIVYLVIECHRSNLSESLDLLQLKIISEVFICFGKREWVSCAQTGPRTSNYNYFRLQILFDLHWVLRKRFNYARVDIVLCLSDTFFSPVVREKKITKLQIKGADILIDKIGHLRLDCNDLAYIKKSIIWWHIELFTIWALN